ncbi:DUF2971 domain-containing protein [Aeromonas veronii]|uniref:DUF2971 domain-containing protein n=1 Tax=Aeromonas veronii TaxID=654 RepID=UPI001D0A29D2|nr:DUF2971 domain-containing protein [Aeromonas veronii]UDN24868.1 DUF2971 domain-containing protein [Aeromonas veronii]
MTIYYKYYSSFFESLILEPTIKLSSPIHLNDPFEKTISDLILTQFKDLTLEEIDKTYTHDIKKICEHLISTLGIISLTESHSNLLMWAHYGNNHKGVCIGYDENFLMTSDKNKSTTNKLFIKKPLKVNYDRTRFDIYTEKFSSTDNYELLKEVLLKTLTTKSDDWLYEKEHRCIVPIEFYDKLLVKEPSPKNESDNYFVIRSAIARGQLKKKDGFYYPQTTVNNGLLEFLSTIDEVSVLKTISEKHIASIFIGCEASEGTSNQIIDIIKGNKKKLGHINIFKHDKHSERFELIPNKITPF